MTLIACPLCDWVDYFESYDDDEEDDNVVFEICSDCLFDSGFYFVIEKEEIWEFLREIDQFSPWESSLMCGFCEVN